MCGIKKPYRYSKEKLLEIKESPYAKQRPACLLEKCDSKGIWKPERWHASLYLKQTIADPRQGIEEKVLDVVVSPQYRSFGGSCRITNTSHSQ
ncbi:eukaryotic translation initiation factor 4E transporter-like [Hypanus sabinus]|uniref:eukaryotic translation initiation factor 4E transporter-like n=1 Tax=Hypanus sabinus TaxID=79690 RepID=UPI0028C44934|nr:eukaryotic translation initiation factor 4E transporter-like [Hypanus sabinus]